MNPNAFDHVALWDPVQEWIEMRLRSDERQIVSPPAIGLTVPFAEGEEMRTEVSAKFRPDGVAAGLVQELPFHGCTGRRGAGSAVGGGGPALVGGDGRGKGPV